MPACPRSRVKRSSTCTSPTSRRPARPCGARPVVRPVAVGGDERFERGDLGGGGPVAWTDHALDHVAVAVDDEGLRVTPHPVAFPDLALGVNQHGEGDAKLLHERLDRRRAVLVLADGEELEIAVAEPAVEPLHRWHLLATGWTPGAPEVQDHHLAA